MARRNSSLAWPKELQLYAKGNDELSYHRTVRAPQLKKLIALVRWPQVFVKISHLWSLSRQKYPYKDTHDQVKRLSDALGFHQPVRVGRA